MLPFAIGAATQGLGSIASGVGTALASPPDLGTKAANKKRDQYVIGIIAPTQTIQVTTGGDAGGVTSSPAISPSLSASTSQEASAAGGQGGQLAQAAKTALSDPVVLIGLGIAAIFGLILFLKR